MGWVYNLKVEGAPTNAPRMIAIIIAFSVLGFLAVSLRFYVRLGLVGKIWLDDWSVLSSMILTIAYSTVTIYQTRWGQALDPKYFPPENTVPFSKVQYTGGPIYTLALLGFKVALLASYLRIGGFHRLYRTIIWIVLGACVVNQLIFTFVICFACQPIAKQWDTSITWGHCIDQVKSYYAIAGTSLGFDLIIIVLPIPVILNLQLRLRQKLALVSIFCLGFFVTIIQIIRVFSIANLKSYTDSESLISWSIVELNLGIVVSSIHTYAPLFRYFAQKVSSRGYGSRGNTYGPSHNSGRQSRHQALTSRSGVDRAEIGPDQSWGRDTKGMETHTVVGVDKPRGFGDNESEEFIIQAQQAEPNSYEMTVPTRRIRATTEVRVESARDVVLPAPTMTRSETLIRKGSRESSTGGAEYQRPRDLVHGRNTPS